MILLPYTRMMVRYNQWQNASLVAAADTLTAEARHLDRGAFFGSIDRTFRHLLLDDQLWHARFTGDPRPEDSIALDLDHPEDWETFKYERQRVDTLLLDWVAGFKAEVLEGEVVWYPSGRATCMSRPRWQALAHLFNHQTHHRGQIHSMLTAAGATPEPTDLAMLSV